MRFLALLVAVQTLTTIILAAPMPTDSVLMPMAAADKCNSCLVTNIRKVNACRWWKVDTPWLPPATGTNNSECVCAPCPGTTAGSMRAMRPTTAPSPISTS